MLRGFNSKISSLGNIHFGKIVLALAMIFSIVFSSFDVVEAIGTLYYYDKFEVINGYEAIIDSKLITRGIQTTWDDEDGGGGIYPPAYSFGSPEDLYMVFTGYGSGGNGYRYGLEPLNIEGYVDRSPFKKQDLPGLIVRDSQSYTSNPEREINFWILVNEYIGWRGESDGNYVDVKGYQIKRGNSKKIKSNFLATTTGTLSQFPTDGVHSDGYWYIRKGIVNTLPILAITTPDGNSYFSK